MTPRLQVVSAFGVTTVAAWSLLPAASALVATGVAAAAASAWVGLNVFSPRSQWIVPTVYRLPRGARHLALTFDDGPDPATTTRVLERLARRGDRATFFMVGRRAEEHPEVVRAVHAAGHQIGSHTFAHATGFHFLRAPEMAAEIEHGLASLAAITGERPVAFRPPIGLRVPTLRAALALLAEPVTCYTWTERGIDTLGRPSAAIVARLLPHVAPGSILTLHDGAGLGGSPDREATLAALDELLDHMDRRGLRSDRLDAGTEAA